MPKNRILSFMIIAVCYILAAFIGITIFDQLNYSPWVSLLIADLAATIFVWVISLLLNNASVYDPYWSLQPLLILGAAVIRNPEIRLGSLLLFSFIFIWGIRLTINWMQTFPGLHKQDWRYDLIKKQSGHFFALVNLMGIQIMPTLIVLACVLPAYYYLKMGAELMALSILGFSFILCGTLLETVADSQMRTFKKRNPDRSELIRSGLWKHSRHPNYLGEIMVWWGVYFVMLVVYPSFWYLGIGAVMNTCLFIWVSIPMAEKHLATYKNNFAQYQKETRMLLPIAKRAL